MSAPKRAAKTTSSKSTTPKKAQAKSAIKKNVSASTKQPTKPVAKSSAKPAVKASAKVSKKIASPKKAPSKAQTVAKKVAKIISKIVAKKKSVAKKPAAVPGKTKKAEPSTKPAKSAAKKVVKNVAAKSTFKASVKSAGRALKKAAGKISRTVAAAVTKTPTPTKTKPTAAVKPTVKTATPKRPKTFAQRDAEKAFGFPADAPELPEFYGEDRLVLMTKDPEYLFAYWEITPDKKNEGEKVKHPGEEYLEAMRLNWTARDIFERNFAVLPVALDARKWYLRVPFSGLAYQIEIGWLGESGHFISLLTSNPSDSPESWNATRRRLKDAAAKGSILEHTLAVGRPQGSSELAPSILKSQPLTGDWNFPGPGTLSSSPGIAKKTARKTSR